MSAWRKRCGSWTSWTVGQVGQAHILNSNYYNSLVINDSNILEEKTRGLPSCQLANLPTFSDQIAEDEWFEYLRTGRLKRFEEIEEFERFERFEEFERFLLRFKGVLCPADLTHTNR